MRMRRFQQCCCGCDASHKIAVVVYNADTPNYIGSDWYGRFSEDYTLSINGTEIGDTNLHDGFDASTNPYLLHGYAAAFWSTDAALTISKLEEIANFGDPLFGTDFPDSTYDPYSPGGLDSSLFNYGGGSNSITLELLTLTYPATLLGITPPPDYRPIPTMLPSVFVYQLSRDLTSLCNLVYAAFVESDFPYTTIGVTNVPDIGGTATKNLSGPLS